MVADPLGAALANQPLTR